MNKSRQKNNQPEKHQKEMQIGCYILTEKIHECTRCEIWKSQSTKDNSTVAIKKIQKKFLLNQSVDLRQVTREVQILYKIKVDGVLSLLDYIENESNSFIVFEYCQQGNLEQLLNQGMGYFSEVIATEFLKKILRLVYNLHFYQKGTILHRNLSLKCVLFDKYGIIKLTSLRLICLIEGQRQEKLNGTLTDLNPYSAPEILTQHNFSMKSDMWAIGVIYYKMLLGEYPFEGKLDNFMYNDMAKKAPKIKKQVEALCKTKKIDKFQAKTLQILEGLFKINVAERYSWKEINELLQMNLPFIKREDLPIGDLDIRQSILNENLIKPHSQKKDNGQLDDSIIPDFENLPENLLQSRDSFEDQMLPQEFMNVIKTSSSSSQCKNNNLKKPGQSDQQQKDVADDDEEYKKSSLNVNNINQLFLLESKNPSTVNNNPMMQSRINKYTSSAYKKMEEKQKQESHISSSNNNNQDEKQKNFVFETKKKKENDLNFLNTSCESVYVNSEIKSVQELFKRQDQQQQHKHNNNNPVVSELNLEQSPQPKFQKKTNNNQITQQQQDQLQQAGGNQSDLMKSQYSEREIQTSIQFHLSRIQSSSKIKKNCENNEKEIQTGNSLVFNQPFNVISISKQEQEQTILQQEECKFEFHYQKESETSIQNKQQQQQQQQQKLKLQQQQQQQQQQQEIDIKKIDKQHNRETLKKQAESYIQRLQKLYEKGPKQESSSSDKNNDLEIFSETMLNEFDRSFNKKEMYLDMTLSSEQKTDFLHEWKINQYLQKVIMRIESLFMHFGTAESLHGCIVLLNMYRMRIKRLLKDSDRVAEGEAGVKNSEDILQNFLQKSKLKMKVEELTEENPDTLQLYRQEIFKLYNQLIQLITESQYQEHNKIVEEQLGIKPIPVEVTLKYSKLAYHLLIAAYFSRVFNGIYKSLVEISEDLFDDIEDAIKDKDLEGMLKLRKQLKTFLKII